MHDRDLDQLLQLTRPPEPSPAAVAAARDLAERLRPPAARRTTWRPRLTPTRLVAAIAGGALLLSGAASLTAYQLSIPPFQTVPDGVQRLQHPIPLDYETPDGTRFRCLLFLELEDVDGAALDRLDAVVRDRDWSPAQQQQAVGTLGEPAPTSQQEALPADAGVALFAFASGVLPGLVDGPTEDDRPALAGFGASCRETGS